MKVMIVLVLALVAASHAVPLSAVQSDDPISVNNGVSQGLAPNPNNTQVAEVNAPIVDNPAPNKPNEHFPVDPELEKPVFVSSVESIAAVPVIDSQNKSLFGVQPPPVVLSRPEETHPMEEKTPLDGDFPCDPNIHINVEMPGLEAVSGYSTPFLPGRYGCSGEYEGGREKASPEVRWDNVAFDVREFSLQLVSMGDDSCPGRGLGAGKILWHVVGMNKTSPSMVLKEGSSKDFRMLNGGKEEPNQWLEDYYSGPCPPPGSTQCYRVKILAHRENGWCQCGFKDFLFTRPDKIENQPWVYNGTLHDDAAAPQKN